MVEAKGRARKAGTAVLTVLRLAGVVVNEIDLPRWHLPRPPQDLEDGQYPPSTPLIPRTLSDFLTSIIASASLWQGRAALDTGRK